MSEQTPVSQDKPADTRPANVSESVVAKIAQRKVAKLPEVVNSVLLSASDAKRLIDEASLKADADLVGLEVAGLRVVGVYPIGDGSSEERATTVLYSSPLADAVQNVKNAILAFRETNKDARPTDIELSASAGEAIRNASLKDWIAIAGGTVGPSMADLIEKKGVAGLLLTRFCGCIVRAIGQPDTFVSSNPLGKLTGHEVKGVPTIEAFVIDPPGAGGACHHYLMLTPKKESGPVGEPIRTPIPNTAMDLLVFPDGSMVLKHLRGWIMLEGGPGSQLVHFQQGAFATAGLNGATHEALLDIIIHRLDCFQNGAHPSPLNHGAITCLIAGLDMLQIRTKERLARGVEGQNKS